MFKNQRQASLGEGDDVTDSSQEYVLGHEYIYILHRYIYLETAEIYCANNICLSK